MKTKLLSLILALSMLVPLAACSNDSGTPDDTAASGGDTAAVTGETTTADPNDRTQIKDNLPDNLNFNGTEIHVLYRGTDATSAIYTHDVGGTDNAGDAVTDAVWARNRKVEQRLGVVFKDTATNAGGLATTAEFVKQLVMAGSDEYDYIISTGNTNVTNSINAYLRDLSNAPYIDYDQPWWWTDSIDALSLDGKTYNYILGDMLVYCYLQTGVLFCNKQMYENLYGDPDALYQLVLDGKWTLDKMIELSAGTYKDVDGDGTENKGDHFGCYLGSTYIPYFYVGMDIDMYHRDDKGNMIIDIDPEAASLATEKMYRFYSESGGILQAGNANEAIEYFASGKMLFLPATFQSAISAVIRDMEHPYGLVPYPKLHEEQKDYISLIHSSSTNISIMKSVPDTRMEAIGAALEALCAESYRTVMPLFLDSALQFKYSPDQKSGQVVNLVIAGVTKNTLDEYTAFTSNIFKNCLTMPIYGSTNFASAYAQYKDAAQNTWNTSVEAALKGSE